MIELQTSNPGKNLVFNRNWADIKAHFIKVVHAFPHEYSVVKDESENGELTILDSPENALGNRFTGEIIFHVSCENTQEAKSNITITASNSDNKIPSYMEFEREKKSLNMFSVLLDKSMKGTLVQPVHKAVRLPLPEINTSQIIFQSALLITALIAIYYAMIDFMK